MLHTAVGFSLVFDNVVCGSAMLGALAESRQCAQGQQLLIEGDLERCLRRSPGVACQGCPGGDIQVSLQWNTIDDLDLNVVTPRNWTASLPNMSVTPLELFVGTCPPRLRYGAGYNGGQCTLMCVAA
jgi:hypothetical protein